jgi:hypothetical protein
MLWWVLGLNPAPFSVFGAVREFRRQSPDDIGPHSEKEFSDACGIALEDLKSRVQGADAETGSYRRLSNPQAVNLFDAYEAFRRVMDGVDRLNFAADFHGEHNQVLFAEAYSTFVKITGWFGRCEGAIQDAGKCSEHRS